jgi:hypothetical protein
MISGGIVNKASVLFIFGLASLAGQAQWIHEPTRGIPRAADGKPDLAAPAPRNADGKPDLSGILSFLPAGDGFSQLKPSEIKAWAEEVHKQRIEDLGKGSPGVQCLPAGGFREVGLMKIVQTPELIVMLREDLTYRQIFLDGRELPKDPNPAWMGYSVGHWDGDTLVVESTGYNDRTWLGNLYPHSENMRVTERMRRSDFGHLAIEAAFSDPAIYEKSWTEKLSGQYTADTELLEYVCAENEKDQVHLVGKNSDDLKNGVKLSPEILSKYVGVYELPSKDAGIPGPELVPLNVVLKDGALKLSLAGGTERPLTPLSETSFVGGGLRIEFGKNDSGEVTHLVVRAAEGDIRANRKK